MLILNDEKTEVVHFSSPFKRAVTKLDSLKIDILESQLKETNKENAVIEERKNELRQKLESTEQSLVSQRIWYTVERKKLQSKLDQKEKLVMDLQHKVKELEQDRQAEFEQDKMPTVNTASEEVLESELKVAKAEQATLEERCKELCQRLERSELSLVSQRIGNTAEREKVKFELEEKEKLVEELQHKVGTGQDILETKLKQAKVENVILEERYNELRQKLESTERSFVSQRIEYAVERDRVQSELKHKEKMVSELQYKVEE
ncbi:polyamine-modulated factor 1-binding protein 1-like [Ptychodera flava]|uniref:polyamine-modulated factor 1-binding protein 1-like n=1 Tax=Ptychodera flava TaxID=63121 RepID=UPI00396A8883